MGVVYMVKKCTNYLKHMLVYLISFVLNYFIFILVMSFIKNNHISIDCGSGYDGTVGCICVDTFEEFYE